MRHSWRFAAVLLALACFVSALPHWGQTLPKWFEDEEHHGLLLAQLRAQVVTSDNMRRQDPREPTAISSITAAQNSGPPPAVAAFGPDGFPRLPPDVIYGAGSAPLQVRHDPPAASFQAEMELGSACMCEDGREGVVHVAQNSTPSPSPAAPAPAPFPPPAPPAESSLNVTTTSLPESAVTFLPPSARGWTANDTYEAQYGHQNISLPSPVVNGTRVMYPEYPPDSTTTMLPSIADAIDKLVRPLNDTENASSRTIPTIVSSSTASEAANVSAASFQSAGLTTTSVAPVTTTTQSDLDHDLALDCLLGQWSDWGPCGQHEGDGMRQTVEERYRPIVNPHHLGGMPCLPRVQRRPCGPDWVNGVYTGTEYSVDSRSGHAGMGIADWVNGDWSPGSIVTNPGSIIPKLPGFGNGNKTNVTIINGTITGPGGITCKCT